MVTVRAMREDDIPALAALHRHVFGRSPAFSPEALCGYFREVLLDSPWRNPDLPSLLALHGNRIAGFLGVVPRPMTYKGRRLTAAVCTQFMVDPNCANGLVAIHLAKEFLGGPQDLALADGANDAARRLWTAFGGASALLYSMHWMRPLRPATHFAGMLRARPALKPVALAAWPLGAAADALMARLRPELFCRSEAGLQDMDLTAQAMLEHLPRMMQAGMLQPVYDEVSLPWLLDQAGRKKRHGCLRGRLVMGPDGQPAGWYLYYHRRGGTAEVVQLAAARDRFGAVLGHLFADAWKQGATAVRGRMEPHHAQQLTERHCWFRRDGPWTIVHSRHSDVANAIHGGDAFLSRLDAEWWMRFLEG
jgi:hypothetical protein